MDQFTELTPKQARFCAEYFVDFNATKAALRAGYSAGTALSGKLMTVPKIQQHLQQRGAKMHEEIHVTSQAVLEEIQKVAFASMGDFFDEHGKLKPMHQVDEGAKAALWHYTLSEDKQGNTTIKIRMANKLGALEKMARILNMYKRTAQEVNYIVVDGKRMNADDCIDDEEEARSQKQEARGTQADDHDGEIPTHEEIVEWMAAAREQGVMETERRLRAEYEEKIRLLEQGIRSQEQGRSSKSEGGGLKSENEPVGDLKNTGFSHPSGEQIVIGENTNNGGNGVGGKEKVRRAPLASPGWDAVPFNNIRAAALENKNTGFSHPVGEEGTRNKEQGEGVAVLEYPQKAEVRYPYAGAGWLGDGLSAG
jgi:phage terminase small subunit